MELRESEPSCVVTMVIADRLDWVCDSWLSAYVDFPAVAFEHSTRSPADAAYLFAVTTIMSCDPWRSA
jgi:hypothetical protein